MDAQPTGIAVVSHPPPRGLKRPLTSIGRSKAQIDAERAARNRQLHLLAAALNGDNNHVAGIAAAGRRAQLGAAVDLLAVIAEQAVARLKSGLLRW